MAYSPYYAAWHDLPLQDTPITAAAASHFDAGIAGSLAAASNLSDVADAPTARGNLHVPILGSVQAVALTNVNIASPGATFDGVTLVTPGTDRLLLAGQTTGTQDGPWIWNGAASALTRPNDYPSGGVMRGRAIQVNGGSKANVGLWIMVTATSITVDTTATTWQLNGSSSYRRRKAVVLDLVEDYGVVFDNATDGTAALNQALADAGNAGGTLTSPTGLPATVQLGVGIVKVSGLVIPSNVQLRGHGDQSIILLTGSSNKNLIQSANYGDPTLVDAGIILRDFKLLGNAANQTAGLHPQTYLTATATVGTSPTTIAVADTTNFPSSGVAWMGYTAITYTSLTPTAFTGCTATSAGQLNQGAWVTPTNSQGHCIALQGHRFRINNVTIGGATASGIYIQGPYAGAYQPETIIEVVRIDQSGRFAIELGLNAPDGQMSKVVTGQANQMGSMLVRSTDWTLTDYHPVGIFNAYTPTPSALHIAASNFSCDKMYADTFPGTVVLLDAAVNGGPAVSDIAIDRLRTFNNALTGGSAVLFRSAPVSPRSAISRVSIGGPNMWSPFDYVISNGPVTLTVGTQNLAAPAGGKVQVKSVLDFAPSSAIGGPVNISTDVLSYTGRQISGCIVGPAGAAIGATTLTVDSTTGFDPAGSVTVVTSSVSGTSFTVMTLTYTSLTPTAFTGIPASGAGSITTAIVGSSSVVSQHYLTGVTGGALTSVAAGSQMFSSALTASAAEVHIAEPIFHSFQRNRMNMQAADDWQIIAGVTGGKKMRSSGTLSVAAGTVTATVAHGMAEAPTLKQVTPTVDTQGLRYWVTASSTNITVTLDSPPLTNPVTFDWRAEITV